MKTLLLTIALLLGAPAAEAAAVKDVARVYGVRDNALFGYGLVTGLNRTGDSLMNEATIRAVANRLQGLGFTVSTNEIMARNVAVVMVTAQLPASARPGQRLDVQVSSSGDAMSLPGSVLRLTLLNAPNGETCDCAGPTGHRRRLGAQAGASVSETSRRLAFRGVRLSNGRIRIGLRWKARVRSTGSSTSPISPRASA